MKRRILIFVISGTLIVLGIVFLVADFSGLIGLGMLLAGGSIFLNMLARIHDLKSPAHQPSKPIDDNIE